MVAQAIDTAVFSGDTPVLYGIAGIALLLPGIAVSARRLHDLDRTAWWLLLALTGIGGIVLLVWDCLKGTAGSNRFGADPLAA
jgi:uncharacterized membrane protein YhaH (DUF805 family)